ncbi:MAG: type IV pilus modification protein PilV [Rhodanobacteraceae bacterium]|nr:MAG: type IV pilus modification protein PilV [Rhodanobacteraceae bacterium]
MTLHRAHPRQQGFSMLEVLIAVLVFSLGMIGLAGLLIFAIQSNHVAYLRTQATFLAHNMADRMGANPAGLWAGAYNGNYPVTGTASCATGCTPAQLATYDMQQWSTQLTTFLPAATGNITCSTNGVNVLPDPTQQNRRPPYAGTCTMTLTWSEAGSAGGATQASIDAAKKGQQPHTFEWVFQP